VKRRLPLIFALALGSSVGFGADVPPILQVPGGEKLILVAHASGWQIYACGSDTEGQRRWTLKGPDADLHDGKGKLIGHHAAGPTWKFKDGSTVTGKAVAQSDSPDPGSIPWLLLTATGHSGKGMLTSVSHIQRVHTQGGQPPALTQCDPSGANRETRSSYTADYYFYKPAK
jgi:hypothetical protein